MSNFVAWSIYSQNMTPLVSTHTPDGLITLFQLICLSQKHLQGSRGQYYNMILFHLAYSYSKPYHSSEPLLNWLLLGPVHTGTELGRSEVFFIVPEWKNLFHIDKRIHYVLKPITSSHRHVTGITRITRLPVNILLRFICFIV